LPGELETNAGRLGHGGRQAGCEARRLEGHEERLRAAGEGGEATQPIGDTGGGRAGVRSRGKVKDEEVDRSAGKERGGDRQALVDRLGGQDDEPVEPDAAGNGLDRIEGASQVEPGDDRPIDLGLRRQSEGEGCLAGARVATDRDARAARQAALPEDRVQCRKAGPDDPLDTMTAGKRRFRVERSLARECLVGIRLVGIRLVGQRHRCQRSDDSGAGRSFSRDSRSCRAPACLEGRQSSRHVRGKRRHRSMIEQMFYAFNPFLARQLDHARSRATIAVASERPSWSGTPSGMDRRKRSCASVSCQMLRLVALSRLRARPSESDASPGPIHGPNPSQMPRVIGM
jgi:hypothetical protein